MFGLHILDLLALAIYLLGVTALGVWAARRVNNAGDFIMPRRFGKAMMLMHGLGTATHSDQAVSVASKSYTTGLSGIWYSWMWLFATPFYWLIAPMMRRFRAFTTGDVFEARYDRSVSGLYAVVGLVKFMFNIGLMLKGTGVIVDAVTEGRMPTNATILVVTLLFVVYGLAGGLSAAIVTDFIQGILTILFSIMLVPLVLSAVGGMEGMRATLHELAPGGNMLSLVTPGNIGVFFIFMIAFNTLLGVAVQPQNMGTCAAGKSEMEGAIGFMGGTMIKRLCTVAWSVTGLAAFAHYGGAMTDPDLIYGQVARDFLPALMPGLLGLFIASLLATVMGSCDSFMVAASGLVTKNIYEPLCRGKSEKHYLAVARASGLVVVIGGVWIAFASEGVVALLEDLWKVNTMMAFAFWLGIFWRRTTIAGAWAATLAAVAVMILAKQSFAAEALANIQLCQDWGIVQMTAGEWAIYLPWQMVFYIVAGFGAGIVASLLTRPVKQAKLDAFYTLMRTPIIPGEEVTRSCTLPPEAKPLPRRVLFPDSQWEIPIPGKTALLGFAAGWVCVIAIIAVVALWIAD